MRVSRLTIENFRGIKKAELHFSGHTLLIGGNNVGKSTVCEALDLVLGPDRLNRTPAVEEFDFHNANYLGDDGTPIPIRIEVVLTNLSPETLLLFGADHVEFWKDEERRVLGVGEIEETDKAGAEFCLRLVTVAKYDSDEDQFTARTIYATDEATEDPRGISNRIKRSIGFLYLRALRTGSRALSLERGSLLDIILRMKEVRTGLWEKTRDRLMNLDPPIDEAASELGPILDEIENRLTDYIPTAGEERATRLFVSQLTREHLRKTIAFFLCMSNGESAIPFQEVGTGTLNTIVLALLTFIAEIKRDNVIFAMEEPEIALPPHTQRRIVNYLLNKTNQCFVTSHSPYVIERFEPARIMRLTRDETCELKAKPINLPDSMKAKTYRSQLRRAIAESMLGRGVIVGEGHTEQFALAAAAKKLEDNDPELFPLDLAGVTIVNTEGEGNLNAMGDFFRELGIPAFAFFDRKQRTADDLTKIQASFSIAREIAYAGNETLMAEETPIDRQWEFLEAVRSRDNDRRYGIPMNRPDEATVKGLTVSTLKGLKGEGGAAELIELCSVGELPPTIVQFLKEVYALYPRPKRRDDQETQQGDKATAESESQSDSGEQ